MTAFGVDPFDAIWESPDTGRTAWKSSDDWCDDCDSEIDFSVGGPDGACECPAHRVDLSEPFDVFLKRAIAEDVHGLLTEKEES